MKKNKEVIDSFIDLYIKYMPKTVYLIKNKDRYSIVDKAVKEITEMALLCDKNAKIEVEPDGLIGTILCLSITTSLFVIDEIDKFCESLKLATTFEVCPLASGDVTVSLTFQDVWISAPHFDATEKQN